MTRKTLSLCLIAAFSFTIQAAKAQGDAKAKSILEAVTKNASGLKSLKANFSLKMLNSAGKSVQSAAGIFYMKGEKYRVELPKQDIISDAKTVWTYSKDAAEVQVSNYNPTEQTLSPAKLFTNFYDKEYTYSYKGTKKVGSKTCSVIELLPISKNKQFTKVELDIDNKNMIASGVVYDKNGGKVQYNVSNAVPNAPVSEAQFTFDARKYPGVEVVDLR